MDCVNPFDFRPESNHYAPSPPSTSSARFPASSDDVLRLLSSSNGIDPTKIWKNGASVQLLVPSPSQAPVFGLGDSKSFASGSGMLPPASPAIRRPPNAYQLFCNDWRPCLKQLTRLSPEDYGYEANRSKILSSFSDENVQRQLDSAPREATLSHLLGVAWKSLSSAARETYETRAEELMEQFKREHLNWRQLLRSPMIAGPGARKRKRYTESSPAPKPVVALVASPKSPLSEDSSSSTADANSDDDEEYQDPSTSRPSKRQRSNSALADLPRKATPSFAFLEPAAIAVSAATRTSIRESDWAHLFNSLLGSSQAIGQLTSGSA